MHRREGAFLDRRGSRSGARLSQPFVERLLAAAPGAFQTLFLSPAPATGLTAADCFSLTGALVDTWRDLSGNGRDATGSGAARPTYSATAVNGRPGLDFDGGDLLATASYADTSADSACWLLLLVDASAAVTVAFERGTSSAASGGSLFPNDAGAGTVRALGTGSAGLTTADTAPTVSLSSPTLICGTWDQTLAIDEICIRVNGADGTVGRTAGNPNNAPDGFGTLADHVGARSGVAFGFTGKIAAAGRLSWVGSLPLAQVQAVEALLMEAWGL